MKIIHGQNTSGSYAGNPAYQSVSNLVRGPGAYLGFRNLVRRMRTRAENLAEYEPNSTGESGVIFYPSDTVTFGYSNHGFILRREDGILVPFYYGGDPERRRPTIDGIIVADEFFSDIELCNGIKQKDLVALVKEHMQTRKLEPA